MYLTTKDTPLCTASRQICKRILHISHAIPMIPIKLIERRTNKVTDKVKRMGTTDKKAGRCKTTANKIRPRHKNTKRQQRENAQSNRSQFPNVHKLDNIRLQPYTIKGMINFAPDRTP